MQHLLKILVLSFILSALLVAFSLLPQVQFSMSAGQMLYLPPDSTSEGSGGEPYPPPDQSPPYQSPPYPPPASEENPSANNDGGAAQVKEALLKDSKMYASMHNVSIDEAVRRLMLQDDVEDINGNLVTKESDTFAGLWIQHEGGFKVVMRFTHEGNTTIKPYIQNTSLEDIVEVRPADVSLEELKSEQLLVTQMINQSDIPFMTGINVIENKVELYVYDAQKVFDYLQDMKLWLPNHTRINEVNHLGEEVEDIYGGLGLTLCTSGFSVYDANGTLGITTAGHCNNEQSYNGVDLPFISGTIPGQEYDIQWHRGDHAFNVVGRIEDGIGGRAIIDEKFRNNQAVGGFVCKYGAITGYDCGYIAEIYVNGINVRVDIPVEGGDSGGPWFLSDTAYGTTIYRCEFGDGTICAIYGPIDQIHEILGLTLAFRMYLPLTLIN